MLTVYTVCAVVGGTILVVQFVLSLLGLAGDHGDLDHGGGIGDLDHGGIGDLDHGGMAEVGHAGVGDLDHGGMMELDHGGIGDLDHGGMAELDHGGIGDLDHGGGADAGSLEMSDAEHAVHHATPVHHVAEHDSTWFFRLLTFRSLVAAVTFFGLGGGLAASSGLGILLTLLAAGASGLAAMAIVAWLWNLLVGLRDDGTVHIEWTLGQPASVYLKVPGHRSGAGKVTVTVQNRTMEYEAVTDEEEDIATGKSVVIVDIVKEGTVKVRSSNRWEAVT